jgi:hypothetical protein
MEKWKDEYAPTHYSVGVGPDCMTNVVHHVHPDMSGRAHCRPAIYLMMDEALPTVPPSKRLCAICRRLAFKTLGRDEAAAKIGSFQ